MDGLKHHMEASLQAAREHKAAKHQTSPVRAPVLRMSKDAPEEVQHTVTGCKKQAAGGLTERHKQEESVRTMD